MVVKSLKKELGIFDFFKSLYNMKIFASKFRTSNLLIYCLVLLGVLAIVNVVIALSTYVSVMNQILLGVIGVPIALFIVYFLLNLFLIAFEGKPYHFWEGYLVFFVVSMHFIILLNVVWLVMNMIYNDEILLFLKILMSILFVYYFVNLVVNLKNYYKTIWQRVLASIVLIKLIFMLIIVTLYFNYILISLGV